MIDNMDQGIGRIRATLDETGQLDNTLIFFCKITADVLEELGRGKPGQSRSNDPSKPTLDAEYCSRT
ncbi:MAG: sulfatase-like hydrolase/transferase [Pirellulaceae bacterium]